VIRGGSEPEKSDVLSQLANRVGVYGIAALVLTVDFKFIATSPGSFAVTLVLIGTTGIVLGLLDLGLLFHFASTSVPVGHEGMNTGVINEEDMHG
jgi:hypothetical protein